MRIFNYVCKNGERRNLVIYKEDEIKKAWFCGITYIIKEDDAERYNKYIELHKDDDIKLNFEEWIDENNIDHEEYSQYWLKEETLKEYENNGYVLADEDGNTFESDIIDYDTIWEYWDGSNWQALVVEDTYGDTSREITDKFPGIKEVASFTGQYDDDGDWTQYQTGRYDTYKDNNGKYYMIDSSFYQGSLDYIEEINREMLVQMFGENFEE